MPLISSLRNRKKFLLFSVLLCLTVLSAQSLTVPAEIQFPLFLKVLSFDRNFAGRNKAGVNIAVLYQSKFRLSQSTKASVEYLMQDAGNTSVSGKQVNLYYLNLSDNTDIAGFCLANKITCVYVLPLRSFDLKRIEDICRAQKIMSLGAIPDDASNGLSCSIGLKNDKPEIIINLNVSRLEGTDFNAQLLKLARIVGD